MARYCPDKDGPALYPDCKECDTHFCDAFFCLVVGSRSFTDYDFLKEKLDYLLQNHDKIVIVSGGANGADLLAERYAEEKGYEKRIFPADWNRHKNQAGYIRNRAMHQYLSKQSKRGVVCFWDGKSPGTAHSFALAKEFQNPIRVLIRK